MISMASRTPSMTSLCYSPTLPSFRAVQTQTGLTFGGRVGELRVGTQVPLGPMFMLIGGGGEGVVLMVGGGLFIVCALFPLFPLLLFVLRPRFFLKSLMGSSGASFAINLLECSNCCGSPPSSEFFASLRLLILGVILSFSISPWALMRIWNSSIQLILRMGSLVSMRVIRFLRKGEMGPGKWSYLLLRTSIRLAIELLWKGHIPKIISNSTTPTDQISALLEYISPLRTYGAMQMGEPNIVLVISSAELRFLQKPKSPSLMVPL